MDELAPRRVGDGTPSIGGRPAEPGDQRAASGRRQAIIQHARTALDCGIPQLASGSWSCQVAEVMQVREHWGKQLVFWRISYRSGTAGSSRRADLVTSWDGTARGADALTALRRFWQAGFRPANPDRVPEPFGYWREGGVLIQGRAAGRTWYDEFRDDARRADRAAVQAAGWLLRLQACALRDELPIQDEHVAQLPAVVWDLAQRLPASAPRLAGIKADVLRRMGSTGARLVPSHGDYHPKNVFVAPGVTTAVDFETVGLRDASFDVGTSIGQALSMSALSLGSFAPGARAALAFWQHYARATATPWERVAAYTSATLLQTLHYTLCLLDTDRVDLVPPWLDLIGCILDDEGPAVLERLAARG